MTVVAVATDHNHVFLVADTLVSVDSKRPRTRRILSGGMTVEIEDQSQYEMFEAQLKLARIGPIGIGYAGIVRKGHAVFEQLQLYHQAVPIETVEALGQLLLERIIPSVTAPNDTDIALCGFFVAATGITKFACVRDTEGRHTFSTSTNPDQGCYIGSGAEEYRADLLPEQDTTDDQRGDLVVGLERVLRPIYDRQIVGDKRFLNRGVGGAVVVLYTDGREVYWQPSRTEVAIQWIKGFGMDAEFSQIPYMQKTFVIGDTLLAMFSSADSGSNELYVRMLRNPLSRPPAALTPLIQTFVSDVTAVTVFLPGGPSDRPNTVTELISRGDDEPFFEEAQRDGRLAIGFTRGAEKTLRRIYVHSLDNFLFGIDAVHLRAYDLRIALDRESATDIRRRWELAYCLADIANDTGDAESLAMAIAIAADIDSPGVEHGAAIDKALRERFGDGSERMQHAASLALAREYDPEFRRVWFYVCPHCRFECVTLRAHSDGKPTTSVHGNLRLSAPSIDAKEWLIHCSNCGKPGAPVKAMWLQAVIAGESAVSAPNPQIQ